MAVTTTTGPFCRHYFLFFLFTIFFVTMTQNEGWGNVSNRDHKDCPVEELHCKYCKKMKTLRYCLHLNRRSETAVREEYMHMNLVLEAQKKLPSDQIEEDVKQVNDACTHLFIFYFLHKATNAQYSLGQHSQSRGRCPYGVHSLSNLAVYLSHLRWPYHSLSASDSVELVGHRLHGGRHLP